MKKFIVVILALITILSTSVIAFADVTVYVNSSSEIPEFRGALGVNSIYVLSESAFNSKYSSLSGIGFPVQKVRVSLGESNYVAIRLTDFVNIKYSDGSNYGGIPSGAYVGDANGSFVYEVPAEETTYSVVAIAGVSNYFLTNRPAGTTGNGYLGDLYLTYDNWLNIQSTLNNLTGDKSYYTYGHSINGEFRYYLANRPSTTTYYVCNSAGQLFYTIKDTGSSEDTGGGGSTFDPTEVITAINSVYDAINSQGSRLANGLSQLTITANTISDIFNLHMNNVFDGFGDIQNSLTTLNGYFSDLSGLFPVQETITLLGSDTRVAWDSADRITGVKTSGFNTGDLIIKERSGPLIDESGYEKVTLSPDTTEYTLSTVDGYRRITASNEYPDTGPVVPDGTFCHFTFNNTLSSNVGDLSLQYTGSNVNYGTGINENAFVFDGTGYLETGDLGEFLPIQNGALTVSFWVNIPAYTTDRVLSYCFNFGTTRQFTACITRTGRLDYDITRPSGSFVNTYSGSKVVPLNSWCHIAMTYSNSTLYCFVNGQLDISYSIGAFSSLSGALKLGTEQLLPSNAMIDDLVIVNGVALWTSNFNTDEAIFPEIAKDYFLPCTNQNIGLVFNDTINKTLSPTDVNGNAITMGRLEDDFSEIYMDISTMMWYCHDPQTQAEILLSSANQQIMNDTIYVRQNYTMLPADQITADALQNLLPVDSPVYLDMPEGAKLTITYDHYSGWFRMMYILMDKQTKLLSDLDIVNETIINVENTVIDITNNNPAYNVFYITKTDGTTESVGDAAKDAAVFVGDVLSMFYRLVFDDALDNVGVIQDFEDVLTTTNTGVNVW